MTIESEGWLSSGHSKPLLSKNYRYYSCKITIKHWQLRDLVTVNASRPSEVAFPNGKYVKYIDMADGQEGTLAEFDFEPRCIKVSDEGWVAAGGVYENGTSASALNSSRGRFSLHNLTTGEQHTRMLGDLINNSVTFYRQPNSTFTDRALVCNNDCSLYFLTIENTRVEPLSYLKLHAPLNHAVISPDGQTVIACGDTPDVTICNPSSSRSGWQVSKIIKTDSDYGFSAAFHPSGMVFGVASQSGDCFIYDIRNTNKLLSSFKSTRYGSGAGAFRCLKFSQGSEDLLFLSEHTDRVHVVDLRDFEHHQILSVPGNFNEEGNPSERRAPSTSGPQNMPDADVPFANHLPHGPGFFHAPAPEAPTAEEHCDTQGEFNDMNARSAAGEGYYTGYSVFEGGSRSQHRGVHRQISPLQPSDIRDYSMSGLSAAQSEPTSIFSIGDHSRTTPTRLDLNGRLDRTGAPESRQQIRTRYGQCEYGISGIAWSDYDGGRLVVGTDSGIAMWSIDGWARRTFPTYTIR